MSEKLLDSQYKLQEQETQSGNNIELSSPQGSSKKKARARTASERTFSAAETLYGRPRNTGSMILLRTADQFNKKVIHDVINHSPSKQQYSFAKATRFSKPRSSYCQQQFYDSQIRTSLGKRTCSFGFGIKFDFAKLTDKYIPPPTAYTIKSKPKPVTKFGYGREETKAVGIYGNPNKNPAPNTYSLKDTFSNIKFSFGERTKAKHIYLESTTPSPFAYNVGGISKTGNYFNSKYSSNKAPLFSPSSNKSIRIIKTPGPGTYDPPGDIADFRLKSSSGFSFGASERKTIQIRNKVYPGPGTYQLPSEFGDIEYPD
ncbi:unnamed protein product [Paramecium sonneborni]|uniref:Uncharacterized protein n=1 Tax=Paramecium sonneborni TaxID=65129 RepID=A0A8S1PG46_9CILI|nr:unnamed protein product [Paramecium sonneborni]